MEPKPVRKPPRSTLWITLASIGLALLLWELITRFAGLPAFILPSPGLVAQRLLRTLTDGTNAS